MIGHQAPRLQPRSWMSGFRMARRLVRVGRSRSMACASSLIGRLLYGRVLPGTGHAVFSDAVAAFGGGFSQTCARSCRRRAVRDQRRGLRVLQPSATPAPAGSANSSARALLCHRCGVALATPVRTATSGTDSCSGANINASARSFLSFECFDISRPLTAHKSHEVFPGEATPALAWGKPLTPHPAIRPRRSRTRHCRCRCG